MRFGFETVIWGRRIDDLELALDQIAACGYQGVEFAQHSRDLLVRDKTTNQHRPIRDIHELLELLNRRDLTLVSLAGGTLSQRMAFCGDFRPEYLCFEHWDEEAEYALNAKPPFTLGLHPHHFIPVHRFSQARKILHDRPSPHLRFLPDTAHLTIVEDDPAEAIQHFRNRLAGVHLKDWVPYYGRYSHRYTRGFVSLGRGTVELKKVLQKLHDIEYQGWVIVEQDCPDPPPAESALVCAEWLAACKLTAAPNRERVFELQKEAKPMPTRDDPLAAIQEMKFVRRLAVATGRGPAAFYQAVANAFFELAPSEAVRLWSYIPTENRMTLLGAAGRLDGIENRILDCSEFLSGRMAKARHVTHFDLSASENRTAFEEPRLLAACPGLCMVGVPIFNASTIHHLRLVMDIFTSVKPYPVDDETLAALADHVSQASNSLLDEMCSSAAGFTSHVCGRSRTKTDFVNQLVELVRKTFDCEGVALFLVNVAGDKLELAASTGTDWRPDLKPHERFYASQQGRTGKTWAMREMFFAPDARSDPGSERRSWEKGLAPGRDECLFAPLAKPRGPVVGVIRLLNKRNRDGAVASTMFTDDDAAALDAIVQGALPHLEVLLNQERQIQALGRLTHEFQVPIVTIRGAIQFMKRAFERRGLSAKQFFGENYLEDIWSWSTLMGRLVHNADIFRNSFRRLTPERQETYLLKDVIAPAVNQVGLLLQEKGLSHDAIQFGDFRDIPPLWIDKNQFQQVFFNLLSNAIKYSEKQGFRVRIESGQVGNDYLIWFSDYGLGIDSGLEEAIFQAGFRGPSAHTQSVAGQGLGLYVVRGVIEAHSGTIKLSGSRNPTRFTITLPKSLVQK